MQDRSRELMFKIVSVFFFFRDTCRGRVLVLVCYSFEKKKYWSRERERDVKKKINKYLMTDDTNKIFNLFHFLTLKSSISKYISWHLFCILGEKKI